MSAYQNFTPGHWRSLLFRSPESEELASVVGLRKALRDSDAAVMIVQGTLGAACLEQVIAEERGLVEPVPTALLLEHGVHPNQTNFSSAGAVDETFGIKFAQVPGHAPKLIISVESIGWALSVYNDERAAGSRWRGRRRRRPARSDRPRGSS